MIVQHDSDCAQHNMPAYPNGPCNCSVLLLANELTDEQIAVAYQQAMNQSLREQDAVAVRKFACAIITAYRALVDSSVEFSIRQHTAARQAELSMRRELADAQAALAAKDAEPSTELIALMKKYKVQHDKLAALTSERDALLKDAERYRWLRSVGRDQTRIMGHYAESQMDDRIDAAMTKEPKHD